MARSEQAIGLGLALASTLLSSACSDRLVLSAPEGVGHWALVVLDLDGAFVSSTALREVEEHLEIELPVGDRALLYTYAPGVIEGLGAGEPEEVPLVARAGCEIALPTPDALYAVSGDALMAAETDSGPELTAPWLGRRCDALGVDDLLVDLGCVLTPCAPIITRDGCSFRVDDNGCRGASFTFGLDHEERACVEGTVCELSEAPEFGLARLSCERADGAGPCPVTFHRRAPFPTVLEERVTVLDVEPAIPDAARYSPYLIRRAFVSDLLLAGDKVLVTSSERGLLSGYFCREGESQRLNVYAKDDLRLLDVRELDRCALAPLLLPNDEFVGFTVDASSSSVLAQFFRLDGSRVRTATIAFEDYESATVLDSLRLAADANVVIVGSPAVYRGFLFMLRDDGSLVWSLEVENLEPSGLAPFGDGFVVSDSNQDTFLPVGRDGGLQMRVPVPATFSRDIGAPWRHAGSGNIVAPMPRDVGQMPILQADGTLHPQRAVSFERPGAPTSVGDWPPDLRLLLVGLTVEEPEPRAYVTRFDPLGGGFVPGMYPMGSGVVSALTTDPEGRVYALLSWAGLLVRLTPL